MSFKRTVESFTCEHCDKHVKGDGYTNHCPECLWSKHADLTPGDRNATCLGLMRPTAVRYKKNEYVVYHQCEKCNHKTQNRASSSDNVLLLISLTKNPITENS